MKASEIKAAAYKAIELLQGARVCGAPLPERKANRILAGLPDSWWRRLGLWRIWLDGCRTLVGRKSQ